MALNLPRRRASRRYRAPGKVSVRVALNTIRPTVPASQGLPLPRCAGRSIGLSHVRVIDGRGRMVADESSMCFIRSIPPQGQGDPAPPTERNEPVVSPSSSHVLDPWQRPALGEVLGQELWDRMSALEIFPRAESWRAAQSADLFPKRNANRGCSSR